MKSTKKSLITSISIMLLSAFMFVGTTFAWFTDTVSNTGNKIQAGTLDVGLHLYNGSSYQNISSDTAPVFNDSLWEPGYSTKKLLKVTNDGTLALKYNLKILSTGTGEKTNPTYTPVEFEEITNLKDTVWFANKTVDVVALRNIYGSPSNCTYVVKFVSNGTEFNTETAGIRQEGNPPYLRYLHSNGKGDFFTVYNTSNVWQDPKYRLVNFTDDCKNIDSNQVTAFVGWLKQNGTLVSLTQLEDLSGYRWTAKSNADTNLYLDTLNGQNTYNIKFTSGDNKYNSLTLNSNKQVAYNTTTAFNDTTWSNNNFKTITFDFNDAGTDKSNKDLIAWLMANGTFEKASYPRLSDVIDVYIKQNATTTDYNRTFDQIKSDSSFKTVGTLTDLLDKELFIENAPIVKASATGNEKVNESLVEIVLHMQEEAGNEYQGLSENFDIRLEATQYTKEKDGFNNNQYDKNATYPISEEPEPEEPDPEEPEPIPEVITNLSGYTWTGNDVINFPTKVLSNNISYYINFDYSDMQATDIYLSYSDNVYHISYSGDIDIYRSGRGWNYEDMKTIKIKSGTDVTNTELIDWLQANGTLTKTD